jgi:hypothetical protein
MKSREKRMRKRRCVKLSAPHPKLHRMTSRINGQVWIMTMLGKNVVLASLNLQDGLIRFGDCNCGTRLADNELRDSLIS